jgi:hypothetical protein
MKKYFEYGLLVFCCLLLLAEVIIYSHTIGEIGFLPASRIWVLNLAIALMLLLNTVASLAKKRPVQFALMGISYAWLVFVFVLLWMAFTHRWIWSVSA